MMGPLGFVLSTCVVAGVAAAFDWRTGRIPNLVTLGALVIAVPLHVYLAGPGREMDGLKSSALGAVLCTLPFLVGWRLGWIAGADVKLVAAMGALGGVSFGLETVFLALLCAASFILMQFAWRGTLMRTVGDTVGLQLARTFSRNKLIAPSPPPQKANLRFGPFAFAGAAMCLALHGGFA